MMNKKLIAKRLRKLRGNTSRSSVSKACGITVSAIENYENAIRIPRDEVKIKLAKYYQVTVEDIFFS